MLRFQNMLGQRSHEASSYAQDASVFPTSHSVRQGHRIGISISGRSKGQRSGSRQRKPIFSKVPSLNCSQGFKGIQHFDRKQSNRTDFNQSLKPTDQTNGKTCCQNILNLMRQQLQLSVQNIQGRMNQQIRKNNEQLIRIESRIKDNDMILSIKQQQIISLKDKLDKAVIAGRFQNEKGVGEISQNHIDRVLQYITSRLRDTDNKIKVVSMQRGNLVINQNETIKKLIQKVDSLTLILSSDYRKRMDQIIQKYQKIEDSFKFKIDDLFAKTSDIQDRFRNNNNQMEQKLESVQRQIMKFKNEIETSLKSVYSRPQNEPLVDNEQFNNLQKIVRNLVLSIKNLESQQQQVNTYIDQIELEHHRLVSQVQKHKIGMTRRASEYKEKQNVQLQNSMTLSKSLKLKNSKSYQYSCLQKAFFPEDDSDPQDQVSNILKRLRQTLQKQKLLLPLQCQIDETGYLKDARSGTYVFDIQGNLFQLSKNDISKAVSEKIIRLP